MSVRLLAGKRSDDDRLACESSIKHAQVLRNRDTSHLISSISMGYELR